MLDALDVAPLVLLAIGGLLYTAGAIVYATKRPNPWPSTFRFHEIFRARDPRGGGAVHRAGGLGLPGRLTAKLAN